MPCTGGLLAALSRRRAEWKAARGSPAEGTRTDPGARVWPGTRGRADHAGRQVTGSSPSRRYSIHSLRVFSKESESMKKPSYVVVSAFAYLLVACRSAASQGVLIQDVRLQANLGLLSNVVELRDGRVTFTDTK